MSKAKAKTINLLLYEGDLSGVIRLEENSWTLSGILYSSPRESVRKLLDTDACRKFGIYLLLSQSKVYVGQSSDLSKRIKQHLEGKDWWTSVVILTSSSDKLNATAIDYLEAALIEKASNLKCLDCDNKNRGNPVNVDEFTKVALEQYLEEALFYMELIGITLFNENNAASNALFDTMDISTRLSFGKLGKADAIRFLEEKGISLPGSREINYATKQPDKKEFFMNPRIEQLERNWVMILNNTITKELVLLKIPAGTLHIGGQSGLVPRPDRPELINLRIDLETYIDSVSSVDFSPFIIQTVRY